MKPRPHIDRKLQRIRRTRGGIVAAVLVLILSFVLDRVGVFGYGGDDHRGFHQQTIRIEHVVDGDTVVIKSGGKDLRVRLIGVDAPELASNDHWADRAKRYLTARTAGKDVVLRLESTETRDRYGRLLAYLYTPEGENLNESLIRDGQAYADRRHPHSFRPQFEAAENEARRAKRGLWKDVTIEQMPEWRQRWLRERQSDDYRPLPASSRPAA
jgi:micrococcal nuclease